MSISPAAHPSSAPDVAALLAELDRLQRRERQLLQLLQSGRDAVVGMDTDGRVIEWNLGAEKLFGWHADEAMGQVLGDLLVPPVHRQAHHHGLQRYLATRESRMFHQLIEVEALCRDGRTVPVELSIWPIQDGDLLGFGAVLRDISQRREVVAALQRSEDRYRAVIEHVGEGMVVVQNNQIVFTNQQAADLVEMPVDEMLRVGYLHRLHPEDQPVVQDRRQRRLAGEDVPNRYEIRLLMPDGRLKWVDIGVTVVPWDGQPATLAFFSDVTARKELENRLTSTLQERETILQSSVVGIAFLTPEGRFRWANQAMLQLFGAGAEVKLTSIETVYASREQYLAVGGEVAGAIRRGEAFQTELEMRRLDGRPIWVSLTGKAVNRNDLSRGTVWTVLDISDRKRAEDEMRLALAQQRELNDLRARFVAMTSHEFRTPLATILSSAELLRFYGDRLAAEERLDIIASIEKGVQRMTTMLDRVLQIGRAEANMLEFAPRPLDDLPALFDSLKADVLAQFPGRDKDVQLDVAAALSGRAYDEKLLRHIFGNLLSNALKYSPQGGLVQVRGWALEAGACFEVSDRGIGIPADEVPHLFESFHRASNVGDIQGTGLGLAIVKKSVELHGGRIEVDSAVGRGTTFRVVL